MSEFILECKDLVKKYGKDTALDGIDLEIKRGRIVGLLGPNGSGKTTLIKLANGLLMPTSGEILIGGDKPSPKTKAKVSYLPDKECLDGHMKIKSLINMFGDFYADFRSVLATEMIGSLGIDVNKPLRTLSKGNREKVQLILAMSRKAELYLLDEPIGGVDPAARDYIIGSIINNYSEDAAVVISTHLIADVESVLDDVVFIKEGHIVLCDSADNIREQEGKSVDGFFREVFKC